ncbi:MAG: protease inhibitor I42 family protein [Hamadaea sp.]|uniref:protease inhibitor I42 family protein n=1 Tax=Hamadaea sp. TaxID=2024425 RepID=UPI0017AA8760|nr:protease inhibitor I42 family protein [Hamadaea sp.]NUR70533.1 protease inhibitor I42 family protein [Hamadaea sp.]NUT18140.1 protease inhibitor I42 family protein [Hamadaea sp.]
MRRWLVWSLVAVVVLVGAVIGGVAVYRKVTYGDRFDASRPTLTVSEGSRFTLVVRDRGASVGDYWTAEVNDPAIAEQVGSTLIADSLSDRVFGPADGGGKGQRLITFEAKATGTTTITLKNCFQGCDTDRRRAASSTVSWSVTVER